MHQILPPRDYKYYLFIGSEADIIVNLSVFFSVQVQKKIDLVFFCRLQEEVSTPTAVQV